MKITSVVEKVTIRKWDVTENNSQTILLPKKVRPANGHFDPDSVKVFLCCDFYLFEIVSTTYCITHSPSKSQVICLYRET